MIDLHCHILPGIDDGPRSIEDSLRMCRIAAEDGIHTVVATPHCYAGRYANDSSTILPVYERLRRRIREEDIGLDLRVAGDMHIDPDLATFLRDNPALCPGGRFVLVELPSEAVPRFIGQFLFALRVKGFTPILTHPERNRAIQKRPAVIEEWLPGGMLTQLTAMSLTGEFGDLAQRVSFEMLDRGCVDFVATDAHSPEWRRPLLSPVAALLRERIGEEGARILLEENPRRVLAGDDPLKIMDSGKRQNFA